MSDFKIGVLGAGVVGLTTAVELQKLFRNAQIDIVAEKFGRDTTSSVAAGLFRPGTSFSGPNEEVTRRWICDAFNYWEDIVNSSYGPKAGVAAISGYIFSSDNPHIVRNSYIEKLVPVYRAATEDELKLCPGNWKYGSFFSTIITQCTIYLPWVTEKFLAANGRILVRKIDNLNDIAAEYDIVVNCTGLGAKYLCNDNKLVPMRGQVIKVAAPWIKTFFYGDYDTYIIPGIDDTVTLGGCRNYDSYNLDINKYDTLSIRDRCESLVPSLKTAKVVDNLVGLRPHRDPVRVEKDQQLTMMMSQQRSHGKKAPKIVHNYGHGGYGVTVAPGTALYACDLVKEFHIGNSKL